MICVFAYAINDTKIYCPMKIKTYLLFYFSPLKPF